MGTAERNNGARNSDAARAHLAAVLLAVAGEDRDAFEELYCLTRTKLFGICIRICGSRESAEDVLHEVYLQIWKRAGAWQPGTASPITWLAAVARNRSIDWRRAQISRPTTPIEDAAEVLDLRPDPEMTLISNDEHHRLLECLNKLEVRRRDSIRTAFFDDASYADVARRAGVPVGTAKSWIRRGLRQLQVSLYADFL